MSHYTFQRVLGIVVFFLASIYCGHSENLSSTLFDQSPFGRNCETLLIHYAELSANFTQCFIENARPITVCKKCIGNYIQVLESHANITKLKDEDTGEACRVKLINMDRLEVIEGNFEYVKQQWQRASCHKCFDHNKTELNHDTSEIFAFHDKVDECIHKHDNAKAVCNSSSEVCADCVNAYQELNYFYDTHGSYNGFCMDVIDMMNTTRYNWSAVLCCCTDRRKPESLYLAVYSSLLLIPVIFYLVIWYFSISIFQENYRSTHGRGGSSELST